MNDAPRYETLQDYVRVVRQHRVLILLITLLFGAAAFAYSARQKPLYEAEASVSFSDPNQDLDLFGTPVVPRQAPADLAATQAEAITSPNTLRAAQKRLKTGLTPGQLGSKITTRVEVRTNFVVIQAQDRRAAFSARVANSVASAAVAANIADERARLAGLIRELRARLKKLGSSPTDILARSTTEERIARLQGLMAFARPAEVVRSASTPSIPVSPRPVRDTLLGLLLGLTLGLIAAFVRESLDRRLRGAREIQDQLKLPLLGHVSADALGRAGFVVNGRGAMSEADLESFRILRTNLEFLDLDSPLRSIIVTSALPEEGKSTVAASLACAHAVAGTRTLLVECDLRRPALGDRLGIQRAPGLTDYLSGHAEPREVVQIVEPPEAPSVNGEMPSNGAGGGDREAGPPGQLACITAGGPAPHPAEMLGSARFRDFLAQVKEAYGVVILDTSPLLSVADTLELLPLADGVLICVRASKTTRDQAKAAKAAIEHFPARPTGLVVTDVTHTNDEYYGFYSYAYAYGEKPRT